jgi:hypothetical protein
MEELIKFDPDLNLHLLVLGAFNALSFLGYGITCIFTEHMKKEFIRYRLPQMRVMVGILQTFAAIVMLYGLTDKRFLFLGALMIVPQMMTGVYVRSKIKDPVIQIIPAFTYLVVSLYLVFAIPVLREFF